MSLLSFYIHPVVFFAIVFLETRSLETSWFGIVKLHELRHALLADEERSTWVVTPDGVSWFTGLRWVIVWEASRLSTGERKTQLLPVGVEICARHFPLGCRNRMTTPWTGVPPTRVRVLSPVTTRSTVGTWPSSSSKSECISPVARGRHNRSTTPKKGEMRGDSLCGGCG